MKDLFKAELQIVSGGKFVKNITVQELFDAFEKRRMTGAFSDKPAKTTYAGGGSQKKVAPKKTPAKPKK